MGFYIEGNVLLNKVLRLLLIKVFQFRIIF